MTRRQAYWSCQVGGWSLCGLLAAVLLELGPGLSAELLSYVVAYVGLGLGVTHAFWKLPLSSSWVGMSPARLLPRLAGGSLAIAALHAGLLNALVLLEVIEPAGVGEAGYWTLRHKAFSLTGGTLLFFLWLFLYYGVHYFWDYRQAEVERWKLESEAKTAKLKTLELQLNPHFLFNSLNSVRTLVDQDPSRAKEMVTRLSRLLRKTLEAEDVKTVPLEEEIDTVRSYLELESIRFQDRLQYDIEAGEEALECPVPFLLLQTLVENGIKHGISEQREGGTITVRAQSDGAFLEIDVFSPGSVDSEEGGTGLKNAKERLRMLFGEEASIDLRNADRDTVVASAVLPDSSAEAAPEPVSVAR